MPPQLRGWQFRWMPSEVITIVSNIARDTGLPVFKCHVPPKMNKFEIKEYFEKIYGLDVKKVNTINYMGKRKNRGNPTLWFRRPDFKKAYVYLNNPSQPNSGSKLP